jgi:hypothetical protein
VSVPEKEWIAKLVCSIFAKDTCLFGEKNVGSSASCFWTMADNWPEEHDSPDFGGPTVEASFHVRTHTGEPRISRSHTSNRERGRRPSEWRLISGQNSIGSRRSATNT